MSEVRALYRPLPLLYIVAQSRHSGRPFAVGRSAVARSGVNGNLKPLALPAALGFIGLSGGFAWIGAFWGG